MYILCKNKSITSKSKRSNYLVNELKPKLVDDQEEKSRPAAKLVNFLREGQHKEEIKYVLQTYILTFFLTLIYKT